jgi:hypothetical protein
LVSGFAEKFLFPSLFISVGRSLSNKELKMHSKKFLFDAAVLLGVIAPAWDGEHNQGIALDLTCVCG